MSELKNKIINGIIEREGGYVNDPNDRGGETNFGITVAVARAAGYTGPMKFLPRELAFEIYCDQYWEPLSLDDVEVISQSVAEEVADTGVNMGIVVSAKFLQRALTALNREQADFHDLVVDGKIGYGTLEAMRDFLKARGAEGEKVLLKALNCLQGARYIELCEGREKNEKFLFGWLAQRVGG